MTDGGARRTSGGRPVTVRIAAGSAVALALLLVVRAGAVDWPDLAELPHPDLASVDPTVREQLTQLREEVRGRLAHPGDDAELGRVLTLLGETYLAYDFLEPAAACLESTRRWPPAEFRSSYLLGYLYERDGRPEKAIGALERAIELRPHDAPALLRLGKQWVMRGEPRRGLPYFERALAADPACAAASYGLGEVARQEGDADTAIAHFRHALDLKPDLNQANYGLALALRSQGRLDEARTYLARIDLDQIRVSGSTWEGCADPMMAEMRGLARSASIHILRGTLAYFQGDYAREVEELRQAVEISPEDHLARRGLAAALHRTSKSALAAEQYREAVRLKPDDPIYHYDLAELLRYIGKLDEAAAHYRRALELNPDFPEPLRRLVDLAAHRGDHEEIVELSRRLLEIEGPKRQTRALLANALVQLGRQDEAREELGRLLDDYPPEEPQEYLRLASMLILMGDAERSERHLRILAEGDGPTAIRALARFRIGLIQLGKGQAADAVRTISAALALDPSLEEGEPALAAARRAAGLD